MATAAVDFLAIAGLLKARKRTGWVHSGVPQPESIADHQYRMALASFLLAGTPGLDWQRCVHIALVHDLAEALVGDVVPHHPMGKEEKHRRERVAIDEICGGLRTGGHESAAAAIFESYAEYEAGTSAEAAAVKSLDKLDMYLQAAEYEAAARGASLLPVGVHMYADDDDDEGTSDGTDSGHADGGGGSSSTAAGGAGTADVSAAGGSHASSPTAAPPSRPLSLERFFTGGCNVRHPAVQPWVDAVLARRREMLGNAAATSSSAAAGRDAASRTTGAAPTAAAQPPAATTPPAAQQTALPASAASPPAGSRFPIAKAAAAVAGAAVLLGIGYAAGRYHARR